MARQDELFIVGIGASAGGIEALEGLFSAFPADTGLAFVVVAHLAPNKVSLLHEILARFTAMPVDQAHDGVTVAPNSIYVIPPNTALTLQRGRLVLHALAALQRAHPIDVFFSSLADDQGDRAIAVVLSGGGSDGTLGIKAIKERGGFTLAQGRDHSAPLHSSMPSSAIATGLVDLVVPVEEMADKLVGYVRSFVPTARLVSGLPGQTAAERAETARREICAILRAQVGHEFLGYKEKTFLRRVQRRMQVVQLTSLVDYIERLRRDADEVNLLFRDLLIGVTAFFRDPAAFAALAQQVIPALFKGKDASDTVRVWVPGCATGEEVFSIAIMLREHLDGTTGPPKVQLFGTDIDETALAVARAARYPSNAFEGVSPERLQRFFTDESGSYQLSKQIRDLCIFSTHSVVRDPPFSRIDLISCRNLLIYLDVGLQAKVVPVFHYALRPGGFLFLGISENVSQHSELFSPIDRKLRIFRRRDHLQPNPQLPLMIAGPRAPSSRADARDDGLPGGQSFRRAIENRVLERFAPAHVVVNREGEVLHYSMRTGKYLKAPLGQPNRQLLAMARKGLRLDLRTALDEAMEKRRIVSREGIAIETDDDRIQLIGLTVEPLPGNEGDPLFLVLFADAGPAMTAEAAARGRSQADGQAGVVQLETDLRHTRERLQAMAEEYETALEELKAANEELVSMNEELQSTNEELETSKEEIQSVNEELQTVNAELGAKVDQLNQANADLNNLFDSTQIAVVFLTRSLAIRSFTPAVTSIFKLIPTDRGRPLTDIACNLAYEGLADDVRHVLASSQPLQRRVSARGDGIHYLMRILPYHSDTAAAGGALVTFHDISVPVQNERQLRTLVQELNHRVRNILAVVSAIASQSVARSGSPAEFAASFLGRIGALGRSHSLLARELWGDIPLAELIRAELEPHTQGQPERQRLEGPLVQLKPKAALSMGMIIHELATNAVKYGALSVPDGTVSVSWQIEGGEGARTLTLRWRESGGPPVEAPRRNGFGSQLLVRQVQHEWSGTIDTAFAADGVNVTLVLPEDGKLYVVPG